MLSAPQSSMQLSPMESLLNFNEPLNVALLDSVVSTFYTGTGADRLKAQQVVTQFQEHPDAWQRADQILEQSTNMNTKYIALQILDKLIRSRWNILPVEQREGIKNYIVALIIKLSSDEQVLRSEKVFINKLNLTLVQILKNEWPKNWPSFIPDIVASSRTSLSLCENNMTILKLLSEEVFDFSAEEMTTIKTKTLKQQLNGEFSEIYNLCSEVLEKAQTASLINATLHALLRFLKWIPLGYIFETELIRMLRDRFLMVAVFRNVTLSCMTEIASLPQVDEKYHDVLLRMFGMVMESVQSMLPLSDQLDLSSIYLNASDEDQKFIQDLALFLTSFLGQYVSVLENHTPLHSLLLGAHRYMLKISEIDDREIFKVCLEYWTKLVYGLYNEMPAGSHIAASMAQHTLMLGSIAVPPASPRRALYSETMSALRLVMIKRMVKPEEVLIVEDENGEIVREFVKETDTITLYKSMREVLVYLTHLDYIDTENIMTQKLERQIDGSEWSWNNLNKLCWAIGSISGAMSEEAEKRFLVTVIKELLSLTEMKRGKDNKAVVASDIMYIVGQYPRFLKAHWKFLKTVVNKLFEFMHETHEGVQDMACDTFIKIAQRCRRYFAVIQPGELKPFVEEIMDNMSAIISDLSAQQIVTFYEAVGNMIQAVPVRTDQTRIIARFMELPNATWDSIIRTVAQNHSALQNPEHIKSLTQILKTNVAACSAIGGGYVTQLSRLFMDLLGLYRTVSGIMSEVIKAQGLIATKTPVIRGMRSVKKESLRLIDTFIHKSEDVSTVVNGMVPSLFDTILLDYQSNVEPARDAEVLTVVASVLTRAPEAMMDKVPAILSAVFDCTLNMINKDFSEYPEHRAALFKLIKVMNASCFASLISLPTPQFKLIVDSIVWSFKHTMRDIADIGLSICHELLLNVAKSSTEIKSVVYRGYFLPLLQDIFFVLTDRDHKAGFKMQITVLAHMFEALETGVINVPLYDLAPGAVLDNKGFMFSYVANLLRNAFPNLHPQQVQIFVQGLYDLNKDLNQFKLHVRDFLIQIKEFGTDNEDLYLEERELEQQRAREAELAKAMQVPGLVKPVDREDMMD